MERQSGLLELSVISWVSAVKGCPLSRVPLYMKNPPFDSLVWGLLRPNQINSFQKNNKKKRTNKKKT